MSKIVCSIVVPFKNFNAETINFITALNHNQGVDNFELIFVIGDSLANPSEIKKYIKKVIGHDFVLLQDKQNDSGPSRCWCLGLKAAQGEYVSFLAVDTFLEKNWCAAVFDQLSRTDGQEFFIGNIAGSYGNKYLDKIETEVDRRRFEGAVVDFRNFIGKRISLLQILDIFFEGKYFSDVELDFVLKKQLFKNPALLSKVAIINIYPKSFFGSVKRKFKHGVGYGRICRIFVGRFRKIYLVSLSEFVLAARILFREIKHAELSFLNRMILIVFNTVFLAGMLAGIFFPKTIIKKYYNLHFDE